MGGPTALAPARVVFPHVLGAPMHSPIRRLPPVVLAFLLVSPSPLLAGGIVDRFGPDVWHVSGAFLGSGFGESIAAAGDVDGDGYGDVITSAWNEFSEDGDGKAYLFRGTTQGSQLTPSWSWSASQFGAETGRAVASAGDVNGDGYDDVLVGVPGWSAPSLQNCGKVSVFHGGPSGLALTPARELFSPIPHPGQQFGFRLAPAGDVNGDGYDDVLIAAYVSDTFVRGGVFLFEGSAQGLRVTAAKTWLGAAGVDSYLIA